MGNMNPLSKETPKVAEDPSKRAAAVKRAQALLEKVTAIVKKARNHFYRSEY